MEDFDSMPGDEVFARREITEKEVASLLGQTIFAYSRFATELHLCVAWLNEGKNRADYISKAEDLAVAELLKILEKQATVTLEQESLGFKRYTAWLYRAHQLRKIRNTIMHSRWGIDHYGRHAIAVSTPVLVTPTKEHIFTLEKLNNVCHTADELINELNLLRKEHPL